jgi:hypothetical protein
MRDNRYLDEGDALAIRWELEQSQWRREHQGLDNQGGFDMKVFARTLSAIVIASGTLSCSSASSGAAKSSAGPKVDPDVISIAEIDSQQWRDAYDIVQVLRPTWFSRKSGSATTRRMGVSTSNSGIGAGLLVYIDNARMGGVDALRQIRPNAIESLTFMDAATATAKLPAVGTSVISGAIVARSRRGF